MRLFLRDLMDRYDQLSLRERVILLVALMLLIALIWDSAFMGPLEKQRKARLQQVEMLRAEVSGLERSAEAVVSHGGADPDKESREALARLRTEIAELDARLAGATSGLIEPKEMARVLEEVLARTARLSLRGLRTLPPEAVIAPSAGNTAAGAAQIFRHGVEIELTGTYLETVQFLQALEALPWRFFWDRVEFTVEQHPHGRVKLLVYTLGLQEGWIGV